MKNSLFAPISALALIVLVGCEKKPSAEKDTAMDIANKRLDSTYVYVTDAKVSSFKIVNEYFPSNKLTESIKAYESANSISEKLKIGDILTLDAAEAAAEARALQAEARAEGMRLAAERRAEEQERRRREEEQKRNGGYEIYDFLSFVDRIKPEHFDLAIKNNEIVAKQVLLMNSYFNELDASTIDAISYYQKLTNEQKTNLFLASNELKPGPDYAIRWIGREFANTYNLQKLQLQQNLNRYLLQRRFINEFPQGFKNLKDLGNVPNDSQFDLMITQK